MVAELMSWARTGGANEHIIFKSDNDNGSEYTSEISYVKINRKVASKRQVNESVDLWV